MKRARKLEIRIAALSSILLPALALAHPGHGLETSFSDGALHPVSGIDHIAGFLLVGMLAARLGGRFLWPAAAAFLGLLVASWTSGSDGWQFAAGFMLTGACLVATAMAATRVAIRARTAVTPCSR
jgi:urease accessory protein